jgi:uncharacterized RDD family membrane protein YckC
LSLALTLIVALCSKRKVLDLFASLDRYQWYLVAASGQSLGKCWCRIRIVRIDGRPADLRGRLFAILEVVPGAGPVLALIDDLMVFRSDRRCLHDLVVGTKIVHAQ